MENLTVTVPDSLLTRIKKMARKQGQTRSALVREALEEHLARRAKLDRPSCLDLSGDLAGKFSGPVDLATNPAHMRGFCR